FMRDNWLSNRIFKSYDDLVDHCCEAWNKLVDQPWRIMSIGLRQWRTSSDQWDSVLHGDIPDQLGRAIFGGDGGFRLWAHQADALKTSLAPKGRRLRNPVVTSATGSGKTESFLLPIFVRLFNEARSWPRPSDINRWWAPAHRQDEPWRHLRSSEAPQRDAAV